MSARIDQLIAEFANKDEVTPDELADTWIVLASRSGSQQLVILADHAVAARAIHHVLEFKGSPLQEQSSRFLASLVAERGSDRLVDWVRMSSSPRAVNLDAAVAMVKSVLDSHWSSVRDSSHQVASWKLVFDSISQDMKPDILLDAAADLAGHHPDLQNTEDQLRTLLGLAATRNEIVRGISGEPRRVLDVDDLAGDAMHQAFLAGEAIGTIWDEPMLEPKAAARALGAKATNREKVRTYRERSWLVGLPHGRGYLYPEFQFDKRTRDVYHEVRAVNETLAAADDPWGTASWWVSYNARLEGARPLDLVGTDRAEDITTVAEAVSEPIG